MNLHAIKFYFLPLLLIRSIPVRRKSMLHIYTSLYDPQEMTEEKHLIRSIHFPIIPPDINLYLYPDAQPHSILFNAQIRNK